ncbi:hypothetical protein BCR32DRAFT_10916 [Anaeromyces robustus]|uniref:Uncharacterized protein n=1 Tax=Anaeromyces robustus TaxID=1754192 RepID=A0A1Y1X6K2_9FUNG|nr:hypothetical protein BCR32DRAFT_10916 [Anaeromyces robustus]|eukprot:ORX81423.1 hypothetical protein BCR32DRAFT_10916 [Anaeromyces robustus]
MDDVDIVEEEKLPNYSVALSLVDFIPVILFYITTIVIARKLRIYHNVGGILFFCGGSIMFISGVLQVFYKLLIAISEKKVAFLHSQFKFCMMIGLVLIIISIIISQSKINWGKVFRYIFRVPCIYFAITAIAACLAMFIFMFTLDSNKLSTNWIEEGTNVFFQSSLALLAINESRME